MGNIITYIVSEGQNLFDVAIETYGSIEGVFQLFADNELGFDHVLFSGQELLVNRNIVTDLVMRNYYEERELRVNTGVADPPLIILGKAFVDTEFDDGFN